MDKIKNLWEEIVYQIEDFGYRRCTNGLCLHQTDSSKDVEARH